MKPILDIYIRKYPFNCDHKRPICTNRLKYIDSNDEAFGHVKYFGWRLLQIAFDNSFGIDIDSLNPHQLETGKWVVDGYYFSISNSGSYVMIGVSTSPIGVDIQKIREIAPDYFMVNEMCEEEIEYYKDKHPCEHYWEHVEKEAIYKCYGTGPMEWKKINSLEYKDRLHSDEYHDCFYTICSDLIKDGIKPNLH